MLRRIVFGLVAGTLSAATVFAQTPPARSPAPAQPPAAAAAAPTTRTFASDGGMVLNFVKPDKTADFEAVIAKLKEALAKSEKPERKEQAKSWKVFKSPDPAAGGNALYVFVIDPAIKGADYTVSNILAEAFPPPRSTSCTSSTPTAVLRPGPEFREPDARVGPRRR